MRKEQIAFPVIRQIAARPRLAELLLGRMRWGNTFSDEFVRNPYAQIPAMLDDGYVTYHRAYQQWFVLGYDEAQQALHHPDLRTSGTRDMLLDVRPYSKLGMSSRDAFSKWLVFTDPPDHTRLRRLVSRWFTPRRIESWRPRVEKISTDLIGAMPTEGSTVDVMASYAFPLPINVIGDILGLTPDTWPNLKVISDNLVQLLDPFRAFDVSVIDASFDELADIIFDTAEKRRAEPTDDLISSLVGAAEDGDRLSGDELVSMVGFIMAAGHETTSGAIGNSIVALARHPAQRRMLRNQPDLLPNAVDELLRYDSPVQSVGRLAVAAVDIGGRTIPAGSNIVVLLGAANRDVRRYDAANELILDRPDPRPISFGHGIHHCLGAALARLELSVAIPALLEALGDYTIDDDAIEWRRVIALRSAERLPVRPG